MMEQQALSPADHEWITSLRQQVLRLEQGGHPRPLLRVFLLQAIRHKLRADYLFWGYGVQDPASFESVTAEFYDDSDDALVFDEKPEERGKEASKRWQAAKKATAYARCSWVAHTLNNSLPMNRILCDIMRATRQPQVTVEQGFLESCASFRAKLSMVVRPHLMLRYRNAGLYDFMFTMRRQGENVSSGIGYHRGAAAGKGRRALEGVRFSGRDRALADLFSCTFDDIVHAVRVDMTALERICRSGKLTYWERVAFPLLVSDRFDDQDIALLLHMRLDRVRRILRDICRKLGIGSERRRSLQCFFYPQRREPEWEPQGGRLSKALQDLRASRQSWEEGFVDRCPEPPLRERRRRRNAGDDE